MPVSASDPKSSTVLHDIKYIGDLSGSYVLASRESHPGDRIKVFGCRSRSVSLQMVVLQAPVKGEIGEALALRLETLGLLKASIVRILPDGFVAELELADSEIATIASRIDWLKQKRLKSLPDRRHAKRWLPRDAHSSLIMTDKTEIDCFIIDVSASGVAVSADAAPAMGHPVVVGTVLGRVVRRLEFGFAVQFLSPHDPQTVESLLAPARENRHDLLVQALARAEEAIAKELQQAEAAEH